ncbi:hypothetical protein HPP92_013950 [Vanilla planifolia]|uniref:Uncharacterized protein n=1 Tax=Vanilla planifolia TaxID=51239 RepID=A0A835USN6_VANPL|nr:hypothetical protein HPP92_014394 [Vanilla planifolia]KAG0474264.1 hypothetical protein HPP92_013950 [Vanilla planifolia]
MDGEQAASETAGSSQHERQGAEIVRGADACYQNSMELLEELGFPKGVMPLKNLEECGRVRATGFVWMKQKAPYEHFFKGTNTRVSYAIEVTAYIEKGKMKRMTGVKSKQMMIWVPIVEMCSIEDGSRVYFKSAVGIGKSFKASAFEEEEKGDN